MDENEVQAIMTAKQKGKLDQLEDELGVTRGTLPIRGQSEGYVFTEVAGITVLITRKSSNPRGGYIVPALSSYTETTTPTNLDAAVRAKALFEKQTPDPDRKYGHLNPIVGMDWKCGNGACPCSSEPPEPYERRMARSIGHPVSVNMPKA
jgi:hypothetical protein